MSTKAFYVGIMSGTSLDGVDAVLFGNREDRFIALLKELGLPSSPIPPSGSDGMYDVFRGKGVTAGYPGLPRGAAAYCQAFAL